MRLLHDEQRRKEVVYGINTGFGNFANVLIPPEEVPDLPFVLVCCMCSFFVVLLLLRAQRLSPQLF